MGPLAIKPTGPIDITDAHLHFDTLITRAGCSGFYELSDMGTRAFYKTILKVMIVNYCFPSTWPSSSVRSEIRKEPQFQYSFGIHPRIVNSSSSSTLQKHFTDLKELVKSTRTVAVGECGIDTSDRRIHMSTQIQYLEKQLTLAVENNLVAVIHCRGDNSTHLAVLQSLTICCPFTQPIHWHCFTCSQEIYKSAVHHFCNIVFGITPFIFGNQYPGLKEFVKTNGIDHLVLESDAPYIKFRNYELTTPYVVNFVAEEIAKLLDIPIEQVFATTYENTTRIYRPK